MSDLERHLAREGRDDSVREVRRQIDESGVTYMYYQFVSVTGRIMGKGIPAKHWDRIANAGFQLVYGSTANLFIDRHGEYIGYGPEARELVGIPDPETFCVLPWDPKTARVFCTLLPRQGGGSGRRQLPHVGLPRQPEAAARRLQDGDRSGAARRAASPR